MLRVKKIVVSSQSGRNTIGNMIFYNLLGEAYSVTNTVKKGNTGFTCKVNSIDLVVTATDSYSNYPATGVFTGTSGWRNSGQNPSTITFEFTEPLEMSKMAWKQVSVSAPSTMCKEFLVEVLDDDDVVIARKEITTIVNQIVEISPTTLEAVVVQYDDGYYALNV